MDYGKVNEEDVFKILCSVNLDFTNPINGVISICDIKGFLGTSRYQVKKHIDSLKNKGLVALKYVIIDSEEENVPPYWGYALTEQGTKAEIFIELKEKYNEAFNKCFGL